MVFTRVEQNFLSAISVLALGIFWLLICAGVFVDLGFGEGVALAVFAGLMIPIIFTAVMLLRKYRKLEEHRTIDYLNLGIQRYILALFMVKYGLPKIYGNFFDYQLFALDSPMGSASEFELAWYLYGLNPWQELFAGVELCEWTGESGTKRGT